MTKTEPDPSIAATAAPSAPCADVKQEAAESTTATAPELGNGDQVQAVAPSATPSEVQPSIKGSLVRKLEEDVTSENSQPERKQLRSSPRRACRRNQSAVPPPAPATSSIGTRRRCMAGFKNGCTTAGLSSTTSNTISMASLRSRKELKKLQVLGAGPKMPGVLANLAIPCSGGIQTRSTSPQSGRPSCMHSVSSSSSSSLTSSCRDYDQQQQQQPASAHDDDLKVTITLCLSHSLPE